MLIERIQDSLLKELPKIINLKLYMMSFSKSITNIYQKDCLILSIKKMRTQRSINYENKCLFNVKEQLTNNQIYIHYPFLLVVAIRSLVSIKIYNMH